ncbi:MULTISPECIES: hypothetical protein [unclassified Thermosipho (in: thermotogales)]|uniref:hypothetical protein n=1 Tax=unclassified Thermosipho (in: thermotogales) TaxID=2676525 RepID=UPI0018CC0F78|nr:MULTISPECIES: hypothetical protein [unclassified Thermosipho (in: thermotogales)]
MRLLVILSYSSLPDRPKRKGGIDFYKLLDITVSFIPIPPVFYNSPITILSFSY